MSSTTDFSARRVHRRLALDRAAGPSDHACHGYSSDEGRGAAAASWLADGLALGQRGLYVADAPAAALGQRGLYVADAPAAALRDELAAHLVDVDDAMARGALAVASTTDLYDLSAPIDAETQLAGYAAAVCQAEADGYLGLRVAADITSLVADPGQRDAHQRWEQFADRFISEHPLAPLCLYDSRRLNDIDPIVCVHHLQGPDASPFALFGTSGTSATLAGEIDACTGGAIDAVLRGMPVTDAVLDLGDLSFVDGHGAWVLQCELVRRRRDEGHPVHVVNPPPVLERIWTCCSFDRSLLGLS